MSRYSTTLSIQFTNSIGGERELYRNKRNNKNKTGPPWECVCYCYSHTKIHGNMKNIKPTKFVFAKINWNISQELMTTHRQITGSWHNYIMAWKKQFRYVVVVVVFIISKFTWNFCKRHLSKIEKEQYWCTIFRRLDDVCCKRHHLLGAVHKVDGIFEILLVIDLIMGKS